MSSRTPTLAAPPPQARLFLALWPPPELQDALEAATLRWQWPPQAARVPAAKRHVTLHFLGAVARTRLPALREAFALPGPPCTLWLDRAALWPGGTAVLQACHPPEALRDWQRRLGSAVAAAGLPLERRPWRPHVTLARRAAGAVPPADLDPLPWPVQGHVLVESQLGAGGGYRILARWEALPPR